MENQDHSPATKADIAEVKAEIAELKQAINGATEALNTAVNEVVGSLSEGGIGAMVKSFMGR